MSTVPKRCVNIACLQAYLVSLPWQKKGAENKPWAGTLTKGHADANGPSLATRQFIVKVAGVLMPVANHYPDRAFRNNRGLLQVLQNLGTAIFRFHVGKHQSRIK